MNANINTSLPTCTQIAPIIQTPLMMKLVRTTSLKSHPLITVNIKPKCVRTILKWDIVLTGKSVNLLMVHKIYAQKNRRQKDSTEHANADLSGIKEIVIMGSDANFPIMNAQIQGKKDNNF